MIIILNNVLTGPLIPAATIPTTSANMSIGRTHRQTQHCIIEAQYSHVAM